MKKKKQYPYVQKLIFLGTDHALISDDLKAITAGSTFLYEREHELVNTLTSAFGEMAYCIRQFQEYEENLIVNEKCRFETYFKEKWFGQISSQMPEQEPIIELQTVELSTFFKTFLLLTKSVLDKLVPLYSYRFDSNLNQFRKNGSTLLKEIELNNSIAHKFELIKLIQTAKAEWLDQLIEFRNEYTHNSSLNEYRNFWTPAICTNSRQIKSVADLNKPTIFVKGSAVEATKYMLSTKIALINFIQEFLQLCDFNPERRPKHYLSCECGYQFAYKSKDMLGRDEIQLNKDDLKIVIKDKGRDYALIMCPQCGGRQMQIFSFGRKLVSSFPKNHNQLDILP